MFWQLTGRGAHGQCASRNSLHGNDTIEPVVLRGRDADQGRWSRVNPLGGRPVTWHCDWQGGPVNKVLRILDGVVRGAAGAEIQHEASISLHSATSE